MFLLLCCRSLYILDTNLFSDIWWHKSGTTQIFHFFKSCSFCHLLKELCLPSAHISSRHLNLTSGETQSIPRLASVIELTLLHPEGPLPSNRTSIKSFCTLRSEFCILQGNPGHTWSQNDSTSSTCQLMPIADSTHKMTFLCLYPTFSWQQWYELQAYPSEGNNQCINCRIFYKPNLFHGWESSQLTRLHG